MAEEHGIQIFQVTKILYLGHIRGKPLVMIFSYISYLDINDRDEVLLFEMSRF